MSARLRPWLVLLRPGDWLVLGGALTICVLTALSLWRGGAPDTAVIRSQGQVFAELTLNRAQTLEVPGPLGTTVIEIEPGRARVASDPGLRQYCVRQGWLSQAGAVAICAPNQVSLALTGAGLEYDTLHY